MATEIDSNLDTVKDDLGKLKADLSSLTTAFQGFAAETVRTKWNGTQEKLDQWTERARSQSRESLEDLAEEIEDRPLTSILLAFGLGVLLGRLFDR